MPCRQITIEEFRGLPSEKEGFTTKTDCEELCGFCCLFAPGTVTEGTGGSCDNTITSRSECENCVFSGGTCEIILYLEENQTCPQGYQDYGGTCYKGFHYVSSCSECNPPQGFNGYGSCNPYGGTGNCGKWVTTESCSGPGMCTPTVCVDGGSSFPFYGGKFEVGPGGYQGFYRGPGDISGTFHIYPLCGSWFLDAYKGSASQFFIREYLGDGCLGDLTNVTVRVYRWAPPPLFAEPTHPQSILHGTYTLNFSPGPCA